MLSELYSLQARSMATSLTVTMHNILTLIGIKSFYNLENWLDLPSTLTIYFVIGVVG